MRVSVQTDSGAVFPLEIGADETVEIIKKRLQSLLLLSSSQHEGQEEEEENDDVEQNQTDHADGVTMIEDMELSLGGRALENRRTLKDYSIVPNAALHLAISRGQDQNLPPADGVAALPQQATSLGTLSALPPEMLTHIMSFVPFEDLIVKVACLNRDWNKLVEDDSLWKMAFGRLWHKEVQEEEERKKLRRKALMEREYQAKKKKLEEDYERKRRELEEEYDKKRKKLESKKKEESWKQVFEQHYVVQKHWKSGKAWLQTLDVKRTINCLLFDDETDLVVCGNHSADGQGGEIRFWNLKKRTCTKTITAHDRWVRGLYWEKDRLFSCSNDKTVKVWNLNTGAFLNVYEGHENNVPMVQVSLADNIMVSCSRDQTVKIWDVGLGDCLTTLSGHSHAVNCVQFKDNVIVSGDRGGHLKVWDFRAGTCIKTMSTGLDVVQCVEFVGGRPNELIVAGGSSRSDEKKYPLEIWDLMLGSAVTSLYGHTGFNWAMQYDQPSGKLVTGGADRSIRVWDVKESKCEGEVLDRAKGRASNHADSIYTLQFSSNRVVSGSKDKTLKVWNFARAGKGHEEDVASRDVGDESEDEDRGRYGSYTHDYVFTGYQME
ncbi:Fbox domain containing protein [Acanthamoeba castellanii str. Neff]|uniref:Fbox domain containing protein n=1 Tax=Acanthamoeba castellanii (strain ATCC 30010 / Neff) TaxID=1257118 RepID=L8GU55_ACACF|nr:Fbox domain containing protein [Acanthamoeba castellanii str. Neff]ELR16482.1 Fbox domain containing protein [Acanthamoeba castellanii str. Neff]